ncbi:hypothetical protein GCM10027085_48940 [Spirosoma aerophilum]
MYILASLLLACYPDVEKVESLPEATQSGRNVFGCLVDGVLWLPKNSSSIIGSSPGAEAVYRLSTHELRISGYQYRQNGGSLCLKTIAVSPGNYSFTPISDYFKESYYYDGPNQVHYSLLDSSSTLTITRLDTVERVVSGKFTVSFSDQQSKKQVKITEGVFDIVLKIL